MATQHGVYRGMSAAARAADRRERLIDAALSVWADPQVSTTMTAVCNTAGLTERYFYESFSGLDDALAAVMDHLAGEIERVTTAARDATAGEAPLARSRAVLTAFVGLLEADPRKGRVALTESMASPTLRTRRTEILRHFAQLTAEAMADAPVSPPRPGHQDQMTGLLFIGGLAELIAAWLDGVVPGTAEELADMAARSLVVLST